MVLTFIFWALFFLPGHAFVRRCWPQRRETGLLYALAFGYAGSLLVLSPLSVACYLSHAPLYVFSAGCALAIVLALGWLARTRADREFLALLASESPVPWLLLFGLLVLQARTGGWLDGDATFHIGRMRALLEHGFSNRDIYLAEDYFQSVYHTNLLYPVYAAIAQLTQQSYLDVWFYTEPWAKLMVAAGHYVFAYALTRQRSAGYLLALFAVTANAGETYALYPNTLCVGFLLPMLLGLGIAFAARENVDGATVSQLFAIDLLLGQVHALYAVYGALLLAPLLLATSAIQRGGRARALALLAIASLAAAAPFVLISARATPSERALVTAPDEDAQSDVPPPPPPGLSNPEPRVPEPPALAAGGGHLEKVMDAIDEEHVVFNPRRMGGWPLVAVGFAALVLAIALRRERRLPIALVLLVALLMAALLFTVTGASAALKLLRTPFVVARLSTVLSMLLFFGVAASLAGLTRSRRSIEALLALAVVALASRVLGQAPISFDEHVADALASHAQRHALLDQLEVRRQLLARSVPSGTTVLTTARFARQLVMLRDCYVLAADRGHTGVPGIDRRRRDVFILNAASTSWQQRERLIAHYDLHLVTFEQRWERRYRWAFEHGRLRDRAAGLDVVELDRAP